MIPIHKFTANTERLGRKIMIYGGGKDDDLGVGKTTLAATAQDCPQMADVLFADLDGGITSVRSRGDVSGAELRKVDEVEKLLWQISQKDASVANFKTLVLDGISELQNNDLMQIAENAALNPGRQRSTPRDKDLNELLDFKKSKNRLLRLLRMARDVSTNTGLNLILTCWAKRVYPIKPGTNEQDFSQTPTIAPDVSKGVNDTLLGFLDDVWYLYADKATHTRYLITDSYITRKNEPITAKTRDSAVASKFTTDIEGVTVPIIVKPTMPGLFARYQAAYAK